MSTAQIVGVSVGVALLIGALLAYVRWRRTGDMLAMLVSGFAAGLAGLARHELFLVAWALAALAVVSPLPYARQASAKREQRSAFAMAYVAAVGGVFGFWLIVMLIGAGDLSFAMGSSPTLFGR